MKLEYLAAAGAVVFFIGLEIGHRRELREAVRDVEVEMENALADRDFHAAELAEKLSRELAAMKEEARLREAAAADREWARGR